MRYLFQISVFKLEGRNSKIQSRFMYLQKMNSNCMRGISLLCDTEMCNLVGKTSRNPWAHLLFIYMQIKHNNPICSTMDKTGKSWHNGLFYGNTPGEKTVKNL